MSDKDNLTGGEKLFLSVVAFLLIKGLIDAKDARDRKRVKSVWRRLKDSEEGKREKTLFGSQTVEPW